MMHRHTAARCVSSENHCPRHNDGAWSKLDWKLSAENHLNALMLNYMPLLVVHPTAYLQLRLEDKMGNKSKVYICEDLHSLSVRFK